MNQDLLQYLLEKYVEQLKEAGKEVPVSVGDFVAWGREHLAKTNPPTAVSYAESGLCVQLQDVTRVSLAPMRDTQLARDTSSPTMGIGDRIQRPQGLPNKGDVPIM